jgi:hypothetical protein
MAKEPELAQPKIKGESSDTEHKDWVDSAKPKPMSPVLKKSLGGRQ